ncbi:MAG: hypothetical protein RLN75_05425, partial [Longimicrobiales bacterium]
SLDDVRALSSLLYEVAAADPWTFGARAAVMAAVGALASWGPALRASRVDPIESLRVGCPSGTGTVRAAGGFWLK